MNNKILIGLLVISLGLNIGMFTMLLYERFSDKEKNWMTIEDNIFETLDLSEEQEMKIANMREEWFAQNDSFIERMAIAEAMLEKLPENSKGIDSLNGILASLEDSHKLLFDKYLKEYEEILNDSQLKIFKTKVDPKIKVIRVKISEDSEKENVDINGIKRVEKDTTKEESK